MYHLFSLLVRPPPTSTLFPYTTLFRSAYIEVFHLFGLTVLLGGAIILALRLSGLAMRSQTLREVHTETRPFVLSALVLVLVRSEEHTSELQSRRDLVCRLLLEKKKQK